MKDKTITKTSSRESNIFGVTTSLPAFLVAYAPEGAVAVDRCRVAQPCKVGRKKGLNLTILDNKVSQIHFQVAFKKDKYWITDLGSTNGTFVNGIEISEETALYSSAVIRVGRVVLVFHEDGQSLFEPLPGNRHDMAGHFHVSHLIQTMHEAALSGRHLLLAGPSGTGKELAAKALTSMKGKTKLIAHNAARFSSEEEAASTLFGVSKRVFSNVDARKGLIEQADGGVLFIDEIHNLPERVQRSLLRVIEDGVVTSIGGSEPRSIDVVFIFASNAPGPYHELAHDLFARLRVVPSTPLTERVADIPAIFDNVLGNSLKLHSLDEQSVFSLLGGDHYEMLCLDGFEKDNVRGLIDLADRISTRIASGIASQQSMQTIFAERFGKGPLAKRISQKNPEDDKKSHYEFNKDLIVSAYNECEGNLAQTAQLLKSRGIRCSRRWLTIFVDQWGLRTKL